MELRLSCTNLSVCITKYIKQSFKYSLALLKYVVVKDFAWNHIFKNNLLKHKLSISNHI